MISNSAEETAAIGAQIARRLSGGDIVLVRGDVGTGKTTLIRGACRALGVEGPVTSPTFTVGRRYRGRLPISHLDLYRLADVGDEAPGLLDDYLTPDTVAFVEWPAAGERSLHPAVEVRIEHGGGDRRTIEIA